jgi:hypothetical protein
MGFLNSFLKKIGVLKPTLSESETETEHCPSDVYMDYETICLSQPQLYIKGIWRKDKFYYIVCPGHRRDASTLNGEDFNHWFQQHKILASPTRISAFIPPGSKKIRILKGKEVADLAGIARNLTYFYYDLIFILPKNFPEFKLRDENGSVTVYSNKEFSKKEMIVFNQALSVLNIRFQLQFEEIDLSTYEQPIANHTPLIIAPSRLLKCSNPKIKEIAEEDEDFWMSNKYKLLDCSIRKNELFQQGFILSKSSCAVTDSNKPGNIRNYLSLYNTVYLRLPIVEHELIYFENLSATQKEIVQLCHLERVKLIADQPLHRYGPKVLHILSETTSSDYIMSRRLAAVNIADVRTRLPFMFPAFGIETKYEILHTLHQVLRNHIPGEDLHKVFECLAIMWGDYFESVQRIGAYGMLNFGAYRLLDLLFKQANKDYGVEFMDAEPAVNYAASLGAYCVTSNSYNNDGFINLMANLYSGVPKNFIRGNQILANTAIENILVINNELPVLEFAQSFKSGDIDRFHKLIYGLTKHNKNEQELLEAVGKFNLEIKHFVKDSKALGSADVRGFLIDAGSTATQTSVPFAGWFVERFLALMNKVGRRNSISRKIQDYLSAFVSDVTPDAVLVARMRSDLIKKFQEKKFGYS